MPIFDAILGFKMSITHVCLSPIIVSENYDMVNVVGKELNLLDHERRMLFSVIVSVTISEIVTSLFIITLIAIWITVMNGGRWDPVSNVSPYVSRLKKVMGLSMTNSLSSNVDHSFRGVWSVIRSKVVVPPLVVHGVHIIRQG